jgi:drug/metabolite transporter (DMT)-like permease
MSRKLGTPGILLGLASAFMFSVMALLVKLCQADLSSGEILLFRAIGGVSILGVLARQEIPKLFVPEAKYVWMRAFWGSISVYAYFWNIRHTSMAGATVLTDLAPLFILLFSFLFYGHKSTTRSTCGGILAVAGVFCLSSPWSATLSPLNVVIGFISAISGAAAYLSLKKSMQLYSAKTVIWCFSIGMAIVSLLDSPFQMRLPNTVSVILIVGVTVTSLLAQTMMALSYKYLPAHQASTLGLTACLWALCFDFALGSPPNLYCVIATIITIIGVGMSQDKTPAYSSSSLKLRKSIDLEKVS